MERKTQHHLSGFTNIATDVELRESVVHGSEEYPFACYLEDVWDFDFHCVDWHWHPELEFVLVKTGRMRVLIGAEQFWVNAGEGLFVNTQVLHRMEAEESTVIPNFLLLPSLLAPEESRIYREFVAPVLYRSWPCLVLRRSSDWQRQALLAMERVVDLQMQEEVSELRTLKALLELWEMIAANVELQPAERSAVHAPGKQADLQRMMQYIHDHYREEITLEEIAGAAMISKSSALKLFDRNLHTSPVAYLIRYRLQQAAGMLLESDRSAAAIALDTGFRDPAYFGRRFRKMYGMTPLAYRKARQKTGKSDD